MYWQADANTPLSVIRGRELNTIVFLKLFGHLWDIPAKSRDIPPKKFDFPGFEGHTEFFGSHPGLHMEDPNPTRKYPHPKVWVCVLLSCLSVTPLLNMCPTFVCSTVGSFGVGGAILLTIDNFSFLLTVGVSSLTSLVFYLQLEFFCLQWESASNKRLRDCKQNSSNCE